MGVKEILKSRRLELGLSMKELADKVGVNEATILFVDSTHPYNAILILLFPIIIVHADTLINTFLPYFCPTKNKRDAHDGRPFLYIFHVLDTEYFLPGLSSSYAVNLQAVQLLKIAECVVCISAKVPIENQRPAVSSVVITPSQKVL